MTVEFEGEKKFDSFYNQVSQNQSSGLTAWFIQKGFAKNERGAKLLMIAITILCFSLTLLVITN